MTKTRGWAKRPIPTGIKWRASLAPDLKTITYRKTPCLGSTLWAPQTQSFTTLNRKLCPLIQWACHHRSPHSTQAGKGKDQTNSPLTRVRLSQASQITSWINRALTSKPIKSLMPPSNFWIGSESSRMRGTRLIICKRRSCRRSWAKNVTGAQFTTSRQIQHPQTAPLALSSPGSSTNTWAQRGLPRIQIQNWILRMCLKNWTSTRTTPKEKILSMLRIRNSMLCQTQACIQPNELKSSQATLKFKIFTSIQDSSLTQWALLWAKSLFIMNSLKISLNRATKGTNL